MIRIYTYVRLLQLKLAYYAQLVACFILLAPAVFNKAWRLDPARIVVVNFATEQGCWAARHCRSWLSKHHLIPGTNSHIHS